jgi:NADPH2:quinone reductase
MRAARCLHYGPVTDVVVEEVPDPTAGPGQVVVDVAAAAVNFPDVLMVANRYQLSAEVPFTPGSEFAGLVASVGEGVVGLKQGDRVSASIFVGAFAEQVAVPAAALRLVPDGLDLESAAALGVAHATAYNALRSVAAVLPGEQVVVLGAGGGVGLAAVEVAHHLGARVIAAASSAEKLEVCRRVGADGLINYESEDLKARIKELGGADVVIDPVGGRYSEAALRSTRWGGRFVCIGFASGEIPRIPLNLVLLKGVTVQGFEFWGFGQHRAEAFSRNRDELYDLAASGSLRPHVSAVHSLAEVPKALQSLADRQAIGKVLIDPRA